MNTSLYLLYLVTAATTVLSPGPGVLMTIMKSIRHGYRGAVWGILGVASGTIIMALITVSGIGAMLRYSPEAYDLLRTVGALYMVWLGWKAWKASASNSRATKRRTSSSTRTSCVGVSSWKGSPSR